MTEERPRVGMGVLIYKDGKILLGKRKNSHGEGEYAPPGGHLEHGESFEEGIKREVREETGIEISNIKFLLLANQRDYLPNHFVNISFTADWESGEPQILEPHKIERWDWYSIDALPTPQYAMLPRAIEAIKTGRNYFDA
jgi:8-oxo-dGTP diphosphatase